MPPPQFDCHPERSDGSRCRSRLSNCSEFFGRNALPPFADAIRTRILRFAQGGRGFTFTVLCDSVSLWQVLIARGLQAPPLNLDVNVQQ
jgi:hypothetical protein